MLSTLRLQHLAHIAFACFVLVAASRAAPIEKKREVQPPIKECLHYVANNVPLHGTGLPNPNNGAHHLQEGWVLDTTNLFSYPHLDKYVYVFRGRDGKVSDRFVVDPRQSQDRKCGVINEFITSQPDHVDLYYTELTK